MANRSDEVPSTCAERAETIKYKGVRKRKWGKWVSEIRLPNSRERIWLGSYDTPVKAARAFDAAQFCLRGAGANFNFPNNPPEIPGGRSMIPAEIQAAALQFANEPFEDVATRRQDAAEEEEEESYSPSISDGQTVQMENEVAGVETSFCNQMGGLNGGFGSGNFASEFGFCSGYDEFTAGEYYSPKPGNFDCEGGGDRDHYDADASIYQDSFLWNF